MSAPAQPPHEITFAEIKADSDKLWDRLDANHDGRIDDADRDARLLEHFAQWDTNHDGMVSKDEFLAHIHAREAEWKAHDHHGPGGMHEHDGHGPDGHGPDGHDGPPPPDGFDGHDGGPGDHGHGPMGGVGGGMGPHHGHRAAMMIIGPAMHEARKDGVITRVAFDTAIKAHFDKIDTNHDGKLSREEMRAARPQHGDWGRGGWHHDHGDMPPPPPPAGQ